MNQYAWVDGFGLTHLEIPDQKGKRKHANSFFGEVKSRNGSRVEFDKVPSKRSGYVHYVER